MAIGAEIPPADPAAIGTIRVWAEMVPGVHLALAATGGGDPWRWRSRGSDRGGRRRLLTRATMGLVSETSKRFWLAGALTARHDRLGWRSLCRSASAGPGNMQHEKYPEESQDDHQGEKLVWTHGVPPSYGWIQGAVYPVFGGRELTADWRYTTGATRSRQEQGPTRSSTPTERPMWPWHVGEGKTARLWDDPARGASGD